jgi:hypothetical protein
VSAVSSSVSDDWNEADRSVHAPLVGRCGVFGRRCWWAWGVAGCWRLTQGVALGCDSARLWRSDQVKRGGVTSNDTKALCHRYAASARHGRVLDLLTVGCTYGYDLSALRA